MAGNEIFFLESQNHLKKQPEADNSHRAAVFDIFFCQRERER